MDTASEKLSKWGFPSWVKFSLIDTLAIAYLGALPPVSYAVLQGVPAYRLFTLAFWIGPAVIGVLFTVALGPALAIGLWSLRDAVGGILTKHSAEQRLSTFVNACLALPLLAIVALNIVQSALPLSLFEISTTIAYFLLVAVALIVAACWLWHHGKPLTEAQSRARALQRLLLYVFLCLLLTGTCWRYLAPWGGLTLAKQGVGGGFPVEFIADDGSTQKGALVLESGAGWFLRFPDRCEVLAFVPSEHMKQQAWLDRQHDYFCHTASQYIDSGDAIFPSDPEIDNPDEPAKPEKSSIYYNP